MIHPNMATTLAFVATDAAISPSLLAEDASRCCHTHLQLHQHRRRHFDERHASGAGQWRWPARPPFEAGVLPRTAPSQRPSRKSASRWPCRSWPMAKARSASSKSKCAAPKSESAARRIGQTIATSPLVKTAFAGGDPNWGRIFAAAGRAGVNFDPARVDIHMAGIPVLRRGHPLDFNERAASNRLLEKTCPYRVNLHAGRAMARYWTCDFTAEYVRINASVTVRNAKAPTTKTVAAPAEPCTFARTSSSANSCRPGGTVPDLFCPEYWLQIL